MKPMSVCENDLGETVVTLPLEGTEDDGSPRQVVVTLPPGAKLDSMTAHEIVETLKRAVLRRGIA
jgi:hypothetical protein